MADGVVGEKFCAVLAGIGGVATIIAFQQALAASTATIPGVLTGINQARAGSYPDGFGERLTRALKRDPIDQRKLNAWFVYQTVTKAPSAQRTMTLAPLSRLGWRDSATQLNLAQAFAEQGNIDATLNRVDALLRRNVAQAQTMSILWALELSGQARPYLTALLTKMPVWRSMFLRHNAGLRNAAMIDARVTTINDLLAGSAPVARGDVAPLLRHLVGRGDTPLAYAIWSRLPRRRAANGLFDPSFVIASETEESGEGSDQIPFEWSFDFGPELSVSFEPRRESNAGDVQIRWSGLGVPTFLQQTFRAKPGRYALRIDGFDGKPALLSKVRFAVRCPSRTVQFARPVGTSASAIVLAADEAIDCDFPKLVMTANVDDAQGRFNINLSGIRLQPLNRPGFARGTGL